MTRPTSPAVADAKSMLQIKEQELANLRESTVKQLELELRTKETELKETISQLQQLKNDFRYNLSLLEDRDQELERYDNEHALLAATLADKERHLSELQRLHADAASEVRMERAKHSEFEFLQQSKRSELQRQLEDERIGHADELMRHKEDCEQAKRMLQRELAEAKEELQQQRREMASGFQIQVQQLESKYKLESSKACQEAEMAMQLARKREGEAKAAWQQESEQIAVAEAAQADANEKEKAVKALSWELDHMKRLKDEQILDLSNQIRTLQQVAKAASQEAESQLLLVSSQLDSALRQVHALSSELSTTLLRQQMQAREEAAVLRVKLEQVQGRNAELECEVREQHGQLRSVRVDMQGKVEELEQELRLVRETSEMALSDYESRREGEVAEVREQLWACQQEARAQRDRAEGLRKALEEKKADVAGFKERLAASGDRERDLQRKLMEMELKLEQQVDRHHEALDDQDTQLVMRLTEQRDAANSALQDAQSRLLDKEAEMGQMRDWMVQLSPRRGESALAAALPKARPATGSRPAHGMGPQDTRGASQGRLVIALPNQLQDSMDSLPDFSQLPSPSSLLLPETTPSPLGQASGGAEGSSSPSWIGIHRPTSAIAAATAAARAGRYLRSSKEGIDELLSPTPHGGSGGGLDTSQQQLLSVALQDSDLQNQRLRSTLAVMREEMENLQTAAAAAAAVVLPQDVSVLQAELQESDRDVAQALEHVEVLQRQLLAMQQQQQQAAMRAMLHPSDSPPSSTTTAPLDPASLFEPELPFLRQRVQVLSVENRQLRRVGVQLKLAMQQQQQSMDVNLSITGGLVAGGSFQSDAPRPVTPTSMLPMFEGGAGGTSLGAGGAPRAATREEELLRRELAEVNAELEQLRVANGRLMEMSNALRADRDRLAAWARAGTSGREADAAGSIRAQQLAMSAHAGSAGVPDANPTASPVTVPSSPHDQTALPYAIITAVPDSVPGSSTRQQLSPHTHALSSSVQGGAAEPMHSSEVFSLEARELSRAASMPPLVSQAQADASPLHYFTDASLRRGLGGTAAAAATAEVALARAQHGASSSPERSRPGSRLNPDSSHMRPDASQHGLGSSEGPHSGGLSPGARHPSAIPGSASARETSSQRARLLSLQRRAEEEASRPKIRNYNFREGEG